MTRARPRWDSRLPRPARAKGERSWQIAVGPVLSALAGVGLWLVFREQSVGKGVDVVAGLVATLIILQIDQLLRVHRREVERTRQARMIEEIEQFPWLADLIGELVHDVHRVELKHGKTLVGEAMRKTINRFAKTVSDFERGYFTTDFDDNAWVFRLTEGCRETLFASSVQDVDLSFWQSPAGEYYWNLHLPKLELDQSGKPKVRITRVFIYREWTADLDILARRQSLAQVEVMRVHVSKVPTRLCKDLIVWDSTVGYETRVNAAGSADENVFTVDREDVGRLQEQIELVRSLAEVFPTKHHGETPAARPRDEGEEGSPSRR